MRSAAIGVRKRFAEMSWRATKRNRSRTFSGTRSRLRCTTPIWNWTRGDGSGLRSLMQPAASVLAAATRQRRCTIAAHRPRIMSGAHASSTRRAVQVLSLQGGAGEKGRKGQCQCEGGHARRHVRARNRASRTTVSLSPGRQEGLKRIPSAASAMVHDEAGVCFLD